MLVDTHGLREHLNDPTWVVFDCRHDLLDHGRGARVYAEGHLPGAHFVPFETALCGWKTGKNGRHPLPDPDAFAAFLGSKGVSASTQVVTYDDAGGQYAARMWWLARWIGVRRVAVLDGGFPKWVAEGWPVDTAKPLTRLGDVTVRPNRSMVATVDEVNAGIAHGRLTIVDARAPERFRGDTEPIDPVAGHIPSARNRFFKTNLNANLTMRPAAEVRREFEALLAGAPLPNVVHQCGSGVTACVNLLAMEYAGLSGSRLYVGSWSEWISNPARPIARGA
jgi:thiosulfate/3-mercaptopyruvate sulfurtransferase